jgi:hypothetical protein
MDEKIAKIRLMKSIIKKPTKELDLYLDGLEGKSDNELMEKYLKEYNQMSIKERRKEKVLLEKQLYDIEIKKGSKTNLFYAMMGIFLGVSLNLLPSIIRAMYEGNLQSTAIYGTSFLVGILCFVWLSNTNDFLIHQDPIMGVIKLKLSVLNEYF